MVSGEGSTGAEGGIEKPMQWWRDLSEESIRHDTERLVVITMKNI